MKCPNCNTEIGGKRFCPVCNAEAQFDGVNQEAFPRKRGEKLLKLLGSGSFWMILVCIAVVIAAQYLKK